jgi:hypothetical protein
VALISCASAGRPPPSPALEAAPTTVVTPAQEAPPLPLPCEGIGTPSSRLGHPLEPPPGTGIRSIDELVSIPGIPVEIVWTSDLEGREVDWALRTGAAKAHGVWALRRVVGGWCVLGSFGSSDPVKAPMTFPAPARVGTGIAVALLGVESLPDEVTKLPTRYVALATDGQRLWFALSGPGGSQLVARESRLRTHGMKLILEVQGAGKSRSVLKFDGTRFVPQD